MKQYLIITVMAGLLCFACTTKIDEQEQPAYLEEAQHLMQNPQPFPVALNYVYPEPGTTVSLSKPDDWRTSYSKDLWVSIKVEALLEAGDHLRKVDNYALTFDGQLISSEPYYREGDDFPAYLRDEEGKVVARGLTEYMLGWLDLMSPGLHLASFRVWSTSGEKEYTYSWAFEVVE